MHTNIQIKPRIRIQNNNEINHLSLGKEIYTQPQTKQNQDAIQNLNYFSTKKNIPMNQSISKWASDHNMEYRDQSTGRGKSTQRVNRIQIKGSNLIEKAINVKPNFNNKLIQPSSHFQDHMRIYMKMQSNQLESQRNQEILGLRQNLIFIKEFRKSIEEHHDSQVLIGEKTVEEVQIMPQRQLQEKLLNLKDNVYSSQRVNQGKKTRIIINDPRSKNQDIVINDKGVIDNSYDQTTYRGIVNKISPKKIANRLSKSLARGSKQQNNLTSNNNSGVQNSSNVSNLYLAQSQTNNSNHPYQSVLKERPNRKIVKLGTTQSKFAARGNSLNRNTKPIVESSIDNTNKNKSSSQDLTLNDSFQSSTRKNQYVIHQSNNTNKIKYFPSNNIIVQNHRSPKGQSQQIATGSVNIQIQVIDNQQHTYKKKGEMRTQRTNYGSVLKSSNLISSLQKKVNDDLSYRQSKIRERAALHERYENTIKQSRVQDTNMSLELSTERKTKIQSSIVNAQRLNYDSINYNNKMGYDIEELHQINVKYHQQLKTLELRGKQSLYSSVFHDDHHAIDNNDYNTVCAIDTEIDLDY